MDCIQDQFDFPVTVGLLLLPLFISFLPPSSFRLSKVHVLPLSAAGKNIMVTIHTVISLSLPCFKIILHVFQVRTKPVPWYKVTTSDMTDPVNVVAF